MNGAHSRRFVGASRATRPLRFGSIGLQGVLIGSIPLQSCTLLLDRKAEEKQQSKPCSGSGGVETPAILPKFAKLWFQFRKPVWNALCCQRGNFMGSVTCQCDKTHKIAAWMHNLAAGPS